MEPHEKKILSKQLSKKQHKTTQMLSISQEKSITLG